MALKEGLGVGGGEGAGLPRKVQIANRKAKTPKISRFSGFSTFCQRCLFILRRDAIAKPNSLG
ncbi:hypothetical protein OII53_19330 [Achromobacter ruhlandii]|uniref:hypothetical protein n=1 Tax=Achromobacter ruhlandii TaxID=72557 RepID=UPI0021F1B550|nr:hypothetical protein [Achromobacter ruhlandii]MCV6799093.1 hypothetical protein [Achromobacter ruhlandii]MCV6803378.1 hypothetical protein [Achromobacter ruhlandii]MCV6811535.1 hypothetical protein [Achromobacter ruhlandii]MCV6820701.1 hypothetical protein [Achromobacter ruhlandii]